MSANILVYNPVASPSDTPAAPRRKLESLRGKVVGFIDNAKPNFEYLVDDLAELLVSKYGVAKVIKHRKIRAGIPVSNMVMQELSKQCDAVIAGSGD